MAETITAPPRVGGVTDAAALTAGPGAPVGGPGARPLPTRVLSRDPDVHGRPTGREEQWRFTPLPRLGVLLDPIAQPAGVQIVAHDLPGTAELVTVGVDDPRVGSVLTPADRISALVARDAPQASVLRIGEGIARLSTRLPDGADAGYGHLVIEVPAGGAATVSLRHLGSGSVGLNTEISLGDGASLALTIVHDADPGAVRAEALAARLGRDAVLRLGVASLGGDVVRMTATVSYAGPGGDAELDGILLAGDGQHVEHRLFVDHQAPHCRSRVLSKAALHGTAHTVWVGDVLIGAGAVGTDTYETNRNLVLTDGARADSVPNLEIETGEVSGAGHASATGRFDDEALFYLQSRGIPPAEARRLVVRGFLADVVARIGDEDTRDAVAAVVERELSEVLAVGQGAA